MKAALKSGVEKGELIQVKMSYKLSADAKKVLKKGPPKKKAAPKKKTTVTKKKTAPKKKAAPKKKVSSLSNQFWTLTARMLGSIQMSTEQYQRTNRHII